MTKAKIDTLNRAGLIKTYKRLKKNTKRFSTYIVRDPLDYLDFDVELLSNLDKIVYEVNTDTYQPRKPYLHLSAKGKGINRPTIVLDVNDALIYRFCIEQIEDELFAKTRHKLKKNIRGSVKITPSKNLNGDDFYEKWFKDWAEHNADIEKSLKIKKWLVCTDIASYFENINILALKDMVRSDVMEKSKILNLLFYFIENTRFRIDYEVNTFTGLLQEDIDCSRVLAYYFLHPHDNAMESFCSENDALFYRFVDDMNVAVNSEVIGKKALKAITESLRKLNLVSSIEKTSILSAAQARDEMFFLENRTLSKIEASIVNKIVKKKSYAGEVDLLIKYYKALILKKKPNYKNWTKVLKRFYTLFTFTKSNFFFRDFKKQVIQYPLLFSDSKFIKYLTSTQEQKDFNVLLKNILDYLYSEENLYPVIESNLLESLLFIEEKNISSANKRKLAELSEKLIFKADYKPLSDYSRGIGCLLLYRFNKSKVDKLANFYLKSRENDPLFKKYLIFVALTSANNTLRMQILNKAKSEQEILIKRLVNFIEKIDTYKNASSVKRYINSDPELYLIYKGKLNVTQRYKSVRADVIKHLISIYGTIFPVPAKLRKTKK